MIGQLADRLAAFAQRTGEEASGASGSSTVLNSELVVGLAVALVASSLAILWPALSAWYRRRRFTRLLRRELAEIGPVDPEPAREGDDVFFTSSRSWMDYLSRHFVHEQFLRPESVEKDFLLSLDPALVYSVSQLWMAYDRRDLEQWVNHLGELSRSKHVKSPGLADALAQWKTVESRFTPAAISGPSRTGWRTASDISPALMEARLSAYSSLLRFTRWNPGEARGQRVGDLEHWYYDSSNGLLLSGDSLGAWLAVRHVLRTPKSGDDKRIRFAMSALRSELKIDLGVREESERDIPTQIEDPVDGE